MAATPAVTIRPIEPGDVDALRRMFFRLSPETVYRRFFRPVIKPSERDLAYLATVDHDRREALVAEVDGEVVGVARYDRPRSAAEGEAEVAIVIEDEWQHHGLGRRLMRELAELATHRGLETFTAEMLAGNQPVVKLVRTLSPDADVRFDHGELVMRAPLPTVTA